MAKTTFNIENAGKPAPRWYRISKRIFYLLMAGGLATGTLSRFGIPDADQNLITGWIIFLLEALGIGLANGEVYAPDPQKPEA